ncbi:AGC/PDK1 protein kinase [Saprolegnia diclina VS20]|uniref:AGC/PDK1 protein kinase n=1 Tax=Saprolegnia diclina (strain VS20) TaxID=1156394 RepID=T0RBK1_SAPDV|nr:AGC/PDK1 protein kinase [Saprolegnia diclina VS20]EQC26917.1 AGC/PDK1 protein kinase [Saprolegnia diclina VS20]|eukprot:XP_008619638.1 AGC/PDK1 protein kinase [Saprolegnia diclina VS20]
MSTVKESTEKPQAADFTLDRELGQGNFSKVFLGTHRASREQFAIKVIEKQRIMRLKIRHPNIFNEVNMEKAVLNTLRHPNIIRLYHTYQDATNLYFLMEYIANGELWDALTLCGKQVGCTEGLARFYAADIVNALEYLASQHIVHRDLKPENMIVSKVDGHLRLVDFGTAKNLADPALNGPNFVGTPEYMSPETIANQSVDTSSDLWALGCIIYQLLTGDTPFQGGSPYLCFLKVQDGVYDVPSFLSDPARDLIAALLQPDPTRRLGANGFDALKTHAFFAGLNFESHMTSSPPVATLEDKFIFESAKQVHAYVAAGGGDDKVPAVLAQAVALAHPRKPRLMHVLDRMQLLQHPDVYLRFFSSIGLGRCLYATKRGYVGLTHSVQNEWKQSFTFAHLSGPSLGKAAATAEMDALGGSSWATELALFTDALLALNETLPALLVLSGNMTHASPSQKFYGPQRDAFQASLATLDPRIRLVVVPGDHAAADVAAYTADFGDDYYALWYGGMKCLVVNSSLWLHAASEHALHERYLAQDAWLKKELEHGALCAQVLCVLSHHPLYIAESDEPTLFAETNCNNNAPAAPWNVPREVRLPLLELVGTSKVHAVFSSHYTTHVHNRFARPGKHNGGDDDDDEDGAPQGGCCDMVVTASFAEGEKSAYHRVHVEQTGLSITRTLLAAPLHV